MFSNVGQPTEKKLINQVQSIPLFTSRQIKQIKGLELISGIELPIWQLFVWCFQYEVQEDLNASEETAISVNNNINP